MVKGKHKLCRWCEEKLFKSREHTCPEMFIHKLKDKEITIRGDDLGLYWKGKKLIIFPKEDV